MAFRLWRITWHPAHLRVARRKWQRRRRWCSTAISIRVWRNCCGYPLCLSHFQRKWARILLFWIVFTAIFQAGRFRNCIRNTSRTITASLPIIWQVSYMSCARNSAAMRSIGIFISGRTSTSATASLFARWSVVFWNWSIPMVCMRKMISKNFWNCLWSCAGAWRSRWRSWALSNLDAWIFRISMGRQIRSVMWACRNSAAARWFRKVARIRALSTLSRQACRFIRRSVFIAWSRVWSTAAENLNAPVWALTKTSKRPLERLSII